jgi:hypothetical protein
MKKCYTDNIEMDAVSKRIKWNTKLLMTYLKLSLRWVSGINERHQIILFVFCAILNIVRVGSLY